MACVIFCLILRVGYSKVTPAGRAAWRPRRLTLRNDGLRGAWQTTF